MCTQNVTTPKCVTILMNTILLSDYYFTFYKLQYRIFVIVGKSNPVLSNGFLSQRCRRHCYREFFWNSYVQEKIPKKIMRDTLNTIRRQLCSMWFTIGIKSSVILLYFIYNLLPYFYVHYLSYYLVCFKLLT